MRSLKCTLLVAAVLAATLSPAQALTARTLSLSLASSAGASITAGFSGTLSKSPVNSTVYLQLKSGTKWLNVKTAKTNSAGAYSGTFTTPSSVNTYTFRAYSSPTSTLATAVSAARIMRVRITLNASTLNPPASSTAGATLSGRIYPWKSTFTKPVLQRRIGTTGNFAGLATLTPNSTTGNFTRSLTGLGAGQTTQYRVVLATSGGYSGATSRTLTLRAGNPVISTKFVPDGIQNAAYGPASAATLKTLDGRPGTWTVTSGSLPNGLSLAASTGLISGTPDTPDTLGFTVQFTDAANRTDTQAFTVTVDPSTNPNDSDQVEVSAGLLHTCRIKVDQTLQCWGSDFKGQLGFGNPDPLGSPRSTSPVAVSGSTWVEVTGGHNYHSCGIKEDYSLWCWGYNSDGQLGMPAGANFPQQVQAGTHWRHVSTGAFHTCGIRTDQTLWCWGQGYGSTPTQVGTASGWDFLDAGGFHTCAVDASQLLWCWGLNSRGWLGTSDPPVDAPLPTQVNLGAWSSITAGSGHTCGVQTDGRLYCWGGNDVGQLGDDSTTERHFPTEVFGSATDWESVSASGSGNANQNHTCAVKTDGTLWCWGSGADGELGGPSTTPFEKKPVQVGTGTNWASVSAGGLHSCAVTKPDPMPADEKTYCWGSNSDGQIGQGGPHGGLKLGPHEVS